MANFNFTETCEPTDLRNCQEGTTFLDPCDCRRYYQCTNVFTMSHMTCNNGTLWDYTLGASGNCNHDRTVEFNQNCEPNDSWLRCNTTANRLEELRLLCTGVTPTTEPNITAKPPDSPGSKVNPGMVAGLILAGAVITLAAIALYVLYSRRKKSKAKKAKRQNTIENREYFQNDTTEDPYAMIDDRMVSPVYNQNNNIISSSRNGTVSTTTTTLPDDEALTPYDNSAFRDVDYTSTLERSPVNPYDTLSASAKSYEKPRNSGDIDPGTSEVNGTIDESDNNKSDNIESDNKTTNSGEETDVDVNDDVQSPDYYKLEKES